MIRELTITSKIKSLINVVFLIGTGLLIATTGLAQDTRVQGDKLIIPVVTVEEQTYSVELTITPESNPPELVLTAAEELIDADTSSASHYGDLQLTVPSADVGGTAYWGIFDLTNSEPVTFQLNSADVDDFDDDNDSVDDVNDPFPYSPGDAADPLQLGGVWDVDFEILIEETPIEGTACDEDPIESMETMRLTWNQQIDAYQAVGIGEVNPQGWNEEGTVSINSELFIYSGDHDEEEGHTDRYVELDIISPIRMEGFEIWTWSSEEFGSCNDIKSKLIANKRPE